MSCEPDFLLHSRVQGGDVDDGYGNDEGDDGGDNDIDNDDDDSDCNDNETFSFSSQAFCRSSFAMSLSRSL